MRLTADEASTANATGLRPLFLGAALSLVTACMGLHDGSGGADSGPRGTRRGNSSTQDNASEEVSSEEYLASLPAACARDAIDGTYHLDEEYAFMPDPVVAVDAVFDRGVLMEFDGVACDVRQTYADGEAVRETECPGCEVWWDCGGCWLIQQVESSLANRIRWTLTTVLDTDCDEYGTGVHYQLTSVDGDSCHFTEGHCRTSSDCASDEECSEFGYCETRPGGGGGGGSSCGEPCSAGCCSLSGLICCAPPFCGGNCVGSPCCS